MGGLGRVGVESLEGGGGVGDKGDGVRDAGGVGHALYGFLGVFSSRSSHQVVGLVAHLDDLGASFGV